LSVGWKLVSLRLSKPTPNSISGTEQLPKLTLAGTGVLAEGAAVPLGAAVTITVLVTVTDAAIAVCQSDHISPYGTGEINKLVYRTGHTALELLAS
jgi:hypothetical protein